MSLLLKYCFAIRAKNNGNKKDKYFPSTSLVPKKEDILLESPYSKELYAYPNRFVFVKYCKNPSNMRSEKENIKQIKKYLIALSFSSIINHTPNEKKQNLK